MNIKKPRAAPGRGLKPGAADDPELAEVLRELRIDPTITDLILIGDGSGSKWGHAAGWACTSIAPAIGEKKTWYGAVNSGTVNLGEVMAYLVPLTYYSNLEADEREAGRRWRTINVHIVTDSEYTSLTGNKQAAVNAKNAILWSAFQAIRAQGFRLTWHWRRREQLALNRYCDKLSKAARVLLKNNRATLEE